MPRLGYFLVNGLTTATVGIGLLSIAQSYVSSIPEPHVQLARADGVVPAWLDPETTSSVTPKAERVSVDAAASQPAADAGRTGWVDPPRYTKASDRSASENDHTMELRH